VEELAGLLPFVEARDFGWKPTAATAAVAPLIRSASRLLNETRTGGGRLLLRDELPPYDPAELIPQKGDAAMAALALERAREAALATAEFTHDGLEPALRARRRGDGRQGGQMFQPVRVAVCGRKNAPPLFETLEVLGRENLPERSAAPCAALLGS
jgi:glutamyl-tRNA synthetase